MDICAQYACKTLQVKHTSQDSKEDSHANNRASC